VQLLWKIVWRFLKKLKIELPYSPGNALLGIYPQNIKTLIQRDIFTPYIYCSIIYNSQIMEAAQVSIDKRMDKEDVIYIYIMLWNTIQP